MRAMLAPIVAIGCGASATSTERAAVPAGEHETAGSGASQAQRYIVPPKHRVVVIGFGPAVKQQFVAELHAAGLDAAASDKELVDLRLMLNCRGDECDCMATEGRDVSSEWVLWGDVVGAGAKAHLVSVASSSVCRHASFDPATGVHDAWLRLSAP